MERYARYIGWPHTPRGVPGGGLDCWGFARMVLGELYGKDLPPFEEVAYGPGRWCRLVDAIRERIPLVSAREVDEPLPGDLVLMTSRGRPIHIGVAVEGGAVLHSEPHSGGVLSRLDDPALKARIWGVYRVD